MTQPNPIPSQSSGSSLPGKIAPEPFGSNEVRLGPRQWSIAVLILAALALLAPRVWERIERFETGPDYRIPYALSKDYWLYQRRLHEAAVPESVVLVGDSVVWGEYVAPDGTLSHFLNAGSGGSSPNFVNGGVNGLFPLAMQGLIERYGGSLAHRRVLLHCNPLWISSAKADLSTPKEEPFNHSRLVPQFSPWIPCYRADAHERLSAWVERRVGFFSWVGHLQNAYFDQRGIPAWTLAEETGVPPRHPNLFRNPLSQITLEVPKAPAADPQRGPASPRHKPWTAGSKGGSQFEWVPLEASLQWAAFQRTVGVLASRSEKLLVIVGPFNEHLMSEENRKVYLATRDGITRWLSSRGIPFLAPEVLPSELYADASHPLTEGYALLAQRIHQSPEFRKWIGAPSGVSSSH